MKEWVSSSTNEKTFEYTKNVLDTYEGKDIKKAVIEKTANGKIKSVTIEFVA